MDELAAIELGDWRASVQETCDGRLALSTRDGDRSGSTIGLATQDSVEFKDDGVPYWAIGGRRLNEEVEVDSSRPVELGDVQLRIGRGVWLALVPTDGSPQRVTVNLTDPASGARTERTIELPFIGIERIAASEIAFRPSRTGRALSIAMKGLEVDGVTARVAGVLRSRLVIESAAGESRYVLRSLFGDRRETRDLVRFLRLALGEFQRHASASLGEQWPVQRGHGASRFEEVLPCICLDRDAIRLSYGTESGAVVELEPIPVHAIA